MIAAAAAVLLVSVVSVLQLGTATPSPPIADLEAAQSLLDRYDINYSKLLTAATVAAWNFKTNITDANKEKKGVANRKAATYKQKILKDAARFDVSNFPEEIRRQFKKLSYKQLENDEQEELGSINTEMSEIYGSTKICLDKKFQEEEKERRKKRESEKEEGEEDQVEEKEEEVFKTNEYKLDNTLCLNLEPGLTEIMGNSNNFAKREFVWQEWREKVGRKMKPLYVRYVELKNKRARLNGFEDYGHEMRDEYEVPGWEDDVLSIYHEMEPLYKSLHAYVRRNLYNVYGADHIDLKGPLPANVLGDMWGRFWGNLYSLMVPYPEIESIDPTEQLKKQNYTVEKMFETADDFYVSMGLLRAPPTFWKNSMLRKPTDGREVVCHATAWDFHDKRDFRIKMCARDYSFEDLNTIHHELGHIQYQQQYKELPIGFRDGANAGFHEAIGELMAMAGSTPKHLYQIGLMNELIEDDRLDVNFLLSQSLITISTLPFHLVNDLWRWRAFRGEYKDGEWNEEYWKLKRDIVGVKPPVERTAEDLDPPTIFHINQDFDMIRYFSRTILQFQFAESLCRISGHTGPLHRCDFSTSKEAGAALAEMLKMGASKPWPDVLETLTGTRKCSSTWKMTARPILEFFKPLSDWLDKENEKNGDVPGWE